MARNEQPSGKKVKILTNWQAAPDGVNVHDYQAGDEHEVGTALMPEDLAHQLANCGVIDDSEFGTKDSEVKDSTRASIEQAEHGGKSRHSAFDEGEQEKPEQGTRWAGDATSTRSTTGSSTDDKEAKETKRGKV